MRVFCRFAPIREEKLQRTMSIGKQLHVAVADQKDQRILTVAEVASNATISVPCEQIYFPSNPDAQHEIFEDVVVPLIVKARKGHKSAVLCYGQTATGKTHTIFGPDGGNTSHYHDGSRGIVPRLAEALFGGGGLAHNSLINNNTPTHVNTANRTSRPSSPTASTAHTGLNKSTSSNGVVVEVRFYEIYNEIVTDLVAQLHYDIDGKPRKTQYKATEKAKIARSLHHMRCTNPAELEELLLTLSEMRLLYATENNVKSSRSHVVIQLNLSYGNSVEGLSGTHYNNGSSGGGGQLTIVDLAGSESLKNAQPLSNGGSTGVTASSITHDIFAPASTLMRLQTQAQQRRQETKNINTSLFALKKVVSSLLTKSRHISYKDSMLTTVLEECLNPSAALIVCCSSDGCDAAETLATLRFASEASKIQPPEAVVSQHRSDVLREAQRTQQEAVAAAAAVAKAADEDFGRLLARAQTEFGGPKKRLGAAASRSVSSNNTTNTFSKLKGNEVPLSNSSTSQMTDVSRPLLAHHNGLPSSAPSSIPSSSNSTDDENEIQNVDDGSESEWDCDMDDEQERDGFQTHRHAEYVENGARSRCGSDDEKNGEKPRPSTDQSLLVENLKNLATDQREHIATLEDEITRLENLLNDTKFTLESTKESHTAALRGQNQIAKRYDALYASHDKLRGEYQILAQQLEEERGAHKKQLSAMQNEIACLQNELKLVDEMGGSMGQIHNAPLKSKCDSEEVNESTTTIEMTPAATHRGRRNSNHSSHSRLESESTGSSHFRNPSKSPSVRRVIDDQEEGKGAELPPSLSGISRTRNADELITPRRAGGSKSGSNKEKATAVIQSVSEFIASVKAGINEERVCQQDIQDASQIDYSSMGPKPSTSSSRSPGNTKKAHGNKSRFVIAPERDVNDEGATSIPPPQRTCYNQEKDVLSGDEGIIRGAAEHVDPNASEGEAAEATLLVPSSHPQSLMADTQSSPNVYRNAVRAETAKLFESLDQRRQRHGRIAAPTNADDISNVAPSPPAVPSRAPLGSLSINSSNQSNALFSQKRSTSANAKRVRVVQVFSPESMRSV